LKELEYSRSSDTEPVPAHITSDLDGEADCLDENYTSSSDPSTESEYENEVEE
jgi:hypothetical protein